MTMPTDSLKQLLIRERALHKLMDSHLRDDWQRELERVCRRRAEVIAQSDQDIAPEPKPVDPMLAVLTRVAVALERIADR